MANSLRDFMDELLAMVGNLLDTPGNGARLDRAFEIWVALQDFLRKVGEFIQGVIFSDVVFPDDGF